MARKQHAIITHQRSGFTLTELLVSISLIVVLMLAVNIIFKSTADTIGAGQALSAGMRDLRSVQTIIKKDLDGAAIADGPFFMIRSNVQVGFLNQKDQIGTPGYTATGTGADVNAILTADLGNGAGAQVQPVTSYGVRTHRQDILGFFSRGDFQRQTGNNGVFAAPMTSNEAFVWYGHLRLPDNSGNARLPGLSDWAAAPTYYTTTTNPNNFYASQWVLGRMAILLKAPQAPMNNPPYVDGTGAGSVIYCNSDASGYPNNKPNDAQWTSTYRQFYIGSPAGSLPPLGSGSASTQNGAAMGSPWYIDSARYDLAGTTISDFRRAVATFGGTWPDQFAYRFIANPFPQRPLTADSAAQTSPIFVPSCAQFVVEYAGDFVHQAGNGDVDGHPTFAVWDSSASKVRIVAWDPDATPPAYVLDGTPKNDTDGEVDFVFVNGVKQIRWYGLPRNVDTSDDPAGRQAIVGVGNGPKAASVMRDVVPLRDIIYSNIYSNADAQAFFTANPGKTFVGAQFERSLPTAQNDYAINAFTASSPNAGPGNGLAPYEQYICAWGPDTATLPRPKMIRILIKPEDPNGKVDLPWQEMVFTLP